MKKTTTRRLSLLLAALLLASSLVACNNGGQDAETTGADTTAETPVTEAPTEAPTETPTEPETEAPTSFSVIKDGQNDYIVYADAYISNVAARTLNLRLQNALGTAPELVVKTDYPASDNAAADVKEAHAIILQMTDAATVGNYGYDISVDGERIIIKSATLSGFDMAIERLCADTVTADGMTVDFTYAAAENLNWITDYTLENYNETYRDDTFYNDKNDQVAYVSNAMWHMFGLVNDGQNLVYLFGNEPTWFEWIGEKVAWSGDRGYIEGLKGKLQVFPQTSTGYMWSWGSRPYWQVDDCYSIHYDGTFRYIAAVYDIISWENSTDFLNVKDYTEDGGRYENTDASKGRTVLEKTEACMQYILDYLHGKDGYIQLTVESTYLNEDGSERFDYVPETGKHCWDNTGKCNSTASNYWDNLCFGNYDAYENALFYQALNSMIGIYRMLGGDYNAKADELEALAVTVKDKYNELYWNETTGRYIACIDTDGNKVDFGLTFLNFEAMKYGLADPERAQTIFDWIDGDRIVEGDDRTGTDIMSYAEILRKVNKRYYQQALDLNLRIAAISNTVAINRKENKKEGIVWWHGPAGINPFGSASFGCHLENGGYIFYPVFYELMARTEFEGAQSTTDRLADIAKVYEYNGLKSDLATSGSAAWLEGLIGEFPESGLVPTAYLYGLLGMEASYDGLHIAPQFNDVYEYMGVRKVTYGGNNIGFEAHRDGTLIIDCDAEGKARLDLHYTPARNIATEYTVTVTLNDGTTRTSTATVDNGVLHLSIDEMYADTITIAPNYAK